MFNFKNNVVVPYSVEKIFLLVNDISEYSKFIPWCVKSSILTGDEFELIAQIDILRFGIHQSFITHNFMVKNQSIIIRLIHGPCKLFFGNWSFIYLDNHMTKVEFDFFYEFHSRLIGEISNHIIRGLISDVVKSFICRASEVYE